MKFGEKQHLEKLQKGVLYCNTITYFSKIEDIVRGDSFETVTKMEYYENPFFQLKPANDPSAEWKNLNVLNMLYKESYAEVMGNLFCMSAFKLNPTKEVTVFKFDNRFLDFGYGLIILRQDLFMERLKTALSNSDYKTCLNLVNYSDFSKYTGEKNLFQKDAKYSWQEEMRLIIYTNKYKMYDPFELSIGSIEDISEIIDLKKSRALEYKLRQQ